MSQTSRDESKPLTHASDCRCNLCIGAAGSPFPSEPVRVQRPPMAGGRPPDLSHVSDPMRAILETERRAAEALERIANMVESIATILGEKGSHERDE